MLKTASAEEETIAAMRIAQRSVKMFFFAFFCGISSVTATDSGAGALTGSGLVLTASVSTVTFFSAGFFGKDSIESKSGKDSKIFPP